MLPFGSLHLPRHCELIQLGRQLRPWRCSIAVTRLIEPVLERNGLPGAAVSLVCGGVDVGKEVVGSPSVDLGGSA